MMSPTLSAPGDLRLILVLVAVLTLALLLDAWGGHYRRGFIHGAQYAPFPVGALLIVASCIAAVRPHGSGAATCLLVAAWLAIATGAIGFVLHHYYGIVRKPGGYRRWLDSLMYGAPPLAPLGLTLLGAIALAVHAGLSGTAVLHGIPLRSAFLTAAVIGLFGAMLQTGILHFRGAFNQPVMYVPLIVPSVACLAAIWALVEPGPASQVAVLCLMWLTVLTGFVGLGMHLRGFDRQMAGLYVPLFNWLQGPPALAPALFAGFAALGLVAVGLQR
jgi:hypothetical protein